MTGWSKADSLRVIWCDIVDGARRLRRQFLHYLSTVCSQEDSVCRTYFDHHSCAGGLIWVYNEKVSSGEPQLPVLN